MELLQTEKARRLEEVQGYYERAANVKSVQKAKFDKWDAQYRGSHEIDGYITDADGNIVEKAKDCEAVWNITFELIEGSIDTDIPQPFVTPSVKCRHNVRNARRIENLIKMQMDRMPFEEYNDQQERTVKKNGTGGVITEWDVTQVTHTDVGDIQVTMLRPQAIFPQPGIKEISDVDYVFVDYQTTRSEIKRRYSLSEDDLDDAYLRTDDQEDEDVSADEDVVTLTVMWYRNDAGDICRFVYSGDLVLEDNNDYYSRKVEYCKTCGRRRQICERDEECDKPDYYVEKLDYDELTEDIQCSDGRIIPAMSPVIKNGELQMETVKMPVQNPDGSQAMALVGGVELPQFMEVQVPKMKPTRLPFYKPRTMPVSIRYNIRDDDSFWGISDCEIIREEQQGCNKMTSRIREATMKAGAALGIPEGVNFMPSNGIFETIIDIPPGVDKNQIMTFAYTVDISQWIVERENLTERAKRKIGVSDSFLGQSDPSAKSGVAKQLMINQSSGRMAPKKIMKQAFYATLFRTFFELYLAFADEPRAIYHSDEECESAGEERFNPKDFYEFDFKTGKWYIDDNYMFAVDMNGAIEQQYPTLWELVKSDYLAGMYGDPTSIDTQIQVWQHLEQLKYPFAKNIVEAKRKIRDQMMAQQMPQAMAGANAMAGGMNGQAPQQTNRQAVNSNVK